MQCPVTKVGYTTLCLPCNSTETMLETVILYYSWATENCKIVMPTTGLYSNVFGG